jgi:hypothetical protein
VSGLLELLLSAFGIFAPSPGSWWSAWRSSGWPPDPVGGGGPRAREGGGSVVVTISYGWFLLAGPAVGGLAELVRLRAALGIIALAGLAVFALSLSLRKTV